MAERHGSGAAALTRFGAWAAVIPEGWTVDEDDDPLAIHPPSGGGTLQVSSMAGPRDQTRTAEDLWEVARHGVQASWNVTPSAIRQDQHGFALDAEGPDDGSADHLDAVMAFRMWPGRFVFATYFYGPDGAQDVEGARAFIASLQPAPGWLTRIGRRLRAG